MTIAPVEKNFVDDETMRSEFPEETRMMDDDDDRMVRSMNFVRVPKSIIAKWRENLIQGIAVGEQRSSLLWVFEVRW